MVAGNIIINNSSGAAKTYYYLAGNVDVNNTTATMSKFGGNKWSEDNIVAIQLQ
jgi:hypothetical protein